MTCSNIQIGFLNLINYFHYMRKTVSIGIPVYNEEKNIGKLLGLLTRTKFQFDLKEILVICSGCTDKSVDIVKNYAQRNHKIRLLIETKRNGKYTAVNKILKHSKGDFIIFVNGDTLPRD